MRKKKKGRQGRVLVRKQPTCSPVSACKTHDRVGSLPVVTPKVQGRTQRSVVVSFFKLTRENPKTRETHLARTSGVAPSHTPQEELQGLRRASSFEMMALRDDGRRRRRRYTAFFCCCTYATAICFFGHFEFFRLSTDGSLETNLSTPESFSASSDARLTC